MLLNAAKCRVTAFTVSELLRKNQQGEWEGAVKLPPPLPPPRLGLIFFRRILLLLILIHLLKYIT